MKIISILFISILAFSQYSCKCECNAQNTPDMTTDTCLTDKFECLDIDKLKKIGESSYNGYSTNYFYKEHYPNGLISFCIEGNEDGRFMQYNNIDTVSNYLSLHKIFQGDGRIEQKGIKCDLGFLVGKWYKFDSFGDLYEVIDYQEHHTFTFAQLKEAVKKEGISLDNLPAKNHNNRLVYPIEVSCGMSEYLGNIPTWGVTYDDPNNSEDGIYGTKITLRYDGRTGELLDKIYMALNPPT